MEQLKKYAVIFWDFDGVIKDSNGVKDWGYHELFKEFGSEVQKKAVDHNQKNGGVSRFQKIPFYLKEFAGVSPDTNELKRYFDEYSRLTVSGVVDSEYHQPVIDYIRSHFQNQGFYIITGSSQEDIDEITEKLKIRHLFREIHGSPDLKPDLIGEIIKRKDYLKCSCAMVGDAVTDYEAAKANEIDFFWLRESDEGVVLSID